MRDASFGCLDLNDIGALRNLLPDILKLLVCDLDIVTDDCAEVHRVLELTGPDIRRGKARGQLEQLFLRHSDRLHAVGCWGCQAPTRVPARVGAANVSNFIQFPNSRPFLPVPRQTGGKRARCQSPSHTPRQRARSLPCFPGDR